jgi:cytochrome c-type biogenesis protein CcmF
MICAQKGRCTSLLSRESLFLFNNLLFIGILVVCFWGVFYPLISELITNEKVTVGPEFYERATGPFCRPAAADGHCAALSVGSFTFKTIGRAAWKPLVASLVVLVAMLFGGGVRQVAALIGLWAASFATVHHAV